MGSVLTGEVLEVERQRWAAGRDGEARRDG